MTDRDVVVCSDATNKMSCEDDKYKTLFEQVNAAAFLTSFDGSILEANHKARDLFGFGWGVLSEMSLVQVLDEGFLWKSFCDEVAARGGMVVESLGVDSSGKRFPVELSVSLFRLDEKPVMFVLLWDISERKENEALIVESEKKYRGLFEATFDGMLIFDVRGGIVDVNSSFCSMFGLNRNDLLGRNLFNLSIFSPASQPVVMNQFENLLSQRQGGCALVKLKTNSSVIDVEMSSFFLCKKEDEVDNFVLVLREVSDRHLIKAASDEQSEMFSLLLECLGEQVVFKDVSLCCIRANSAKCEFLGIGVNDVVGRFEDEFVSSECASRLRSIEKGVLHSSQSFSGIFSYELLSEEVVNVDLFVVPRFDLEGSVVGVLSICVPKTN